MITRFKLLTIFMYCFILFSCNYQPASIVNKSNNQGQVSGSSLSINSKVEGSAGNTCNGLATCPTQDGNGIILTGSNNSNLSGNMCSQNTRVIDGFSGYCYINTSNQDLSATAVLKNDLGWKQITCPVFSAVDTNHICHVVYVKYPISQNQGMPDCGGGGKQLTSCATTAGSQILVVPSNATLNTSYCAFNVTIASMNSKKCYWNQTSWGLDATFTNGKSYWTEVPCPTTVKVNDKNSLCNSDFLQNGQNNSTGGSTNSSQQTGDSSCGGLKTCSVSDGSIALWNPNATAGNCGNTVTVYDTSTGSCYWNHSGIPLKPGNNWSQWTFLSKGDNCGSKLTVTNCPSAVTSAPSSGNGNNNGNGTTTANNSGGTTSGNGTTPTTTAKGDFSCSGLKSCTPSNEPNGRIWLVDLKSADINNHVCATNVTVLDINSGTCYWNNSGGDLNAGDLKNTNSKWTSLKDDSAGCAARLSQANCTNNGAAISSLPTK